MNANDNESEDENIFTEWFEFIYNQDFQQKVIMCVNVSLELYRVMVSSLLVLFVPQDCNGHICSIFENINSNDNYKIYLIMNYITAGCFMMVYIAEIRREEKLIKLLEVNNTISTDSDSVGKRIERLPEYKKQQIFYINLQYQYLSYLSMIVFTVNTIMSSIIIYKHSLGNQTLINLTTNILFMISKLTNILGIINTEKNIFFSAYLNTKVQFNDLDPREIEKLYMIEMKNEIYDKMESMIKEVEQKSSASLSP